MANPYENYIEETKWGLESKDAQKSALFNKYKSLYNPYNPTQQNLYVEELIKQFEDTLEQLALLYENHYNDQEVGIIGGF